LTKIFTAETADALTARGEALRERLNALCRAQGAAMQFTGLGSLMNLHMTDGPIRRPGDDTGDSRLRDLFFFDMAEAGFYLARRGFIAMMLPLGEAETDAFVGAVEAFLVRRRTLLSA
jgi:glutamate-1-semialdehyde 2,1-aminomutase